jgi:prophage antirepressor-like protein
MSFLIDLYKNILNINNINIFVLIDINGKLWFHANKIASSLGYKKSYESINTLVSKKNIRLFHKIKIIKSPITMGDLNNDKSIQKSSKFINEHGLYEFLLNSKIKIAKKLKDELIMKILPSLRETGEIIYNNHIKKQITNNNDEIHKLLINVKNIDYPDGNHIYIIKQKVNNKTYYKIGYTKNLNKRIKTYNTGNANKIYFNYIIKVDDNEMDNCIKKVMKNHEHIKNKEFYKISLNIALKFINKCDTSINDIYCGYCLKCYNFTKIGKHICKYIGK